MSEPVVARKGFSPIEVNAGTKYFLSSFRLPVLAALGVAMFGLAACSSLDKSKEPPPCPRVSILSDAQKMTRFRPGEGRDITDIELTAELSSYHGSCKYDAEAKRMEVTLRVGIDAQLGPAARSRDTEIAYFIALPSFYPKPQAKQVMTVPLSFPSNTSRVRYTDEDVNVSFPVPNIKDLAKDDIILGLQLSPGEVEYNRRQKAGQ